MRTLAGQPWVLWALGVFFLGLGFKARFDLPLGILAISAMFAFSAYEQQGKLALRDHWPLAGFLVVSAVVTFFSSDRPHSLGVQPQLLPALLCYAVIVSFAVNAAAVRFVCLSLLVSGLLTAVLILTAGSANEGDPLRRVLMMGNALLIVPNDVLMLSVIAPLAVAAAWHAGRMWQLLAMVYLLLALWVSAAVQSRQAVMLLIAGPVMTITLLRPRWGVPILLAGLSLVVVIDALLGWPLASKIFMFPRLYVWHAAWVMFLDSPWVGQGPGMFRDLYFPFVEKAGYVIEQLDDRRTMPWAHSLYLEQLAERGIGGLLVLLALLGTAASRLVHQWRSATGMDEEVRVLASGVLASLLVLIMAGIAEASLLRLWVMVCLLVLVALSLALGRCLNCDRVDIPVVGRC